MHFEKINNSLWLMEGGSEILKIGDFSDELGNIEHESDLLLWNYWWYHQAFILPQFYEDALKSGNPELVRRAKRLLNSNNLEIKNL